MKNIMEHNTKIVAFFTATSREVTEPQLTYNLSISNNNETLDDNERRYANRIMMQKRMHIILCYENHENSENCGWHVQGWMKESLSYALMDHPVLAGRIRRSEDGGLELVSNDSGVRCVRAEIGMSLVEFLECKERRFEVEEKLVYWKDVGTNPQFSPLFYVQVTNFQCGGYSLGISCSLLLTNPLFMVKFLNKWAAICRSNDNQSEIPILPSFDNPKFHHIGCSEPTNSRPIIQISRNVSKTILFEILVDGKFINEDETCNYLVLLCLEEGERKTGMKMSSIFTLITKKQNGNVKIEISSKRCLLGSSKNLKYVINSMNLDDLKVNEIAFRNGDGPVDASYWMSGDALGGLLAVKSSVNEHNFVMQVFVTFPSFEGN